MKLPTLPQWLTMGASAALVSVVSQLREDPASMFTSASGIKAAVAGAVVGALVHVMGLYQTAPQNRAIVNSSGGGDVPPARTP